MSTGSHLQTDCFEKLLKACDICETDPQTASFQRLKQFELDVNASLADIAKLEDKEKQISKAIAKEEDEERTGICPKKSFFKKKKVTPAATKNEGKKPDSRQLTLNLKLEGSTLGKIKDSNEQVILGKLDSVTGLESMLYMKKKGYITYSNEQIFTFRVENNIIVHEVLKEKPLLPKGWLIQRVLCGSGDNLCLIIICNHGCYTIKGDQETRHDHDFSNKILSCKFSATAEARMLGITEVYPKTVEMVSIRDEKIVLTFVPIEKIDGVQQTIKEYEVQGSKEFIQRCQENNHRLIQEHFIYSSNTYCRIYDYLGTITVKICTIIQEKDVFGVINYQIQQLQPVQARVDINMRLAEMRSSLEDRMHYLVSKDTKFIYRFDRFHEGGSAAYGTGVVASNEQLAPIIELSEHIRKVNYISTRKGGRFILANVNEGEIAIWAIMNNNHYGQIFHFYNKSLSKRTVIYLSDDLAHLILCNGNKVQVCLFGAVSTPELRFLNADFKLSQDEVVREERMLPGSRLCLIQTSKELFVSDPDPTCSIRLVAAPPLEIGAKIHRKMRVGHFDPDPEKRKNVSVVMRPYTAADRTSRIRVYALLENIKGKFAEIHEYFSMKSPQFQITKSSLYVFVPEKSTVYAFVDLRQYMEGYVVGEQWKKPEMRTIEIPIGAPNVMFSMLLPPLSACQFVILWDPAIVPEADNKMGANGANINYEAKQACKLSKLTLKNPNAVDLPTKPATNSYGLLNDGEAQAVDDDNLEVFEKDGKLEIVEKEEFKIGYFNYHRASDNEPAKQPDDRYDDYYYDEYESDEYYSDANEMNDPIQEDKEDENVLKPIDNLGFVVDDKGGRNRYNTDLAMSKTHYAYHDANDVSDDNISLLDDDDRAEMVKTDAPRPEKRLAVVFDVSDTTPVRVGEFALASELDCVKISDNQRFVVFGGSGGYQLFEIIFHCLDVCSIEPRAVVFNCLKRRWSSCYQIARENDMEFSSEGRHLAMAFEDVNIATLMSIKVNAREESPTSVENSVVLARGDILLSKAPILFKFVKSVYTVTQAEYLCYFEISAEKSQPNSLSIFDTRTYSWVRYNAFHNNMVPVHAAGDRDNNIVITIENQDEKDFQGFYLFFDELHLTEMPAADLFRRNLINHFLVQGGTRQKYFEDILTNTFKIMDEEYIAQDPRVTICMFVLDKQGLFEEAFSKRIDIARLISSMNIFHLMFTDSASKFMHSMNSLNKMFDEYIEKYDRFPAIDEDLISVLLTKDPEKLTFNPASKKMLSSILYSPCKAKVTGLIARRMISMIPLSHEENTANMLSEIVIKTKAQSILLPKASKMNEYDVYRTRVPLELTNGSQASQGLMSAVMAMPDDEIRYKYRQLINYKWHLLRGVSVLYLLLFYTLNVLAYVYFGYNPMFSIGVLVIILNGVFILFDAKVFAADWRHYLRDPMNWIDLVVHGFSIFAVVVSMINYLSSIHEYFKLVAIILISLRGIVHLKMFGPLRVLVMMLVEIIYDLRYIVVILIGLLCLAATVYKVAPLPGGQARENLSFIEALQNVSILMFMGSKADESEVADRSSTQGILRSIIMVLVSTLCAQGIFNLIIAIFLQTVRKVSNDRDVYELRSILLDINYFDGFLRGLSWLNNTLKNYFIILVPVPKNGSYFENEDPIDKLNSMMSSVMVEISKKGLEKLGAKAKALLPGQSDFIDGTVNELNSNAKVDKDVSTLLNMADKIRRGQIPNDSDLKELTEAVAKMSSKQVKSRITSAMNAASKIDTYFNQSKDSLSAEGLITLIFDLYESLFPGGKYNKQTTILKTALTSLAQLSNSYDKDNYSEKINATKRMFESIFDLLSKNEEYKNKVESKIELFMLIFEEFVSKKETKKEINLESVMTNAVKLVDEYSIPAKDYVTSSDNPFFKLMSLLLNNLDDIKAKEIGTDRAIELAEEVAKSFSDTPNTKAIFGVAKVVLKKENLTYLNAGHSTSKFTEICKEIMRLVCERFDNRQRKLSDLLIDTASWGYSTVQALQVGKLDAHEAMKMIAELVVKLQLETSGKSLDDKKAAMIGMINSSKILFDIVFEGKSDPNVCSRFMLCMKDPMVALGQWKTQMEESTFVDLIGVVRATEDYIVDTQQDEKMLEVVNQLVKFSEKLSSGNELKAFRENYKPVKELFQFLLNKEHDGRDTNYAFKILMKSVQVKLMTVYKVNQNMIDLFTTLTAVMNKCCASLLLIDGEKFDATNSDHMYAFLLNLQEFYKTIMQGSAPKFDLLVNIMSEINAFEKKKTFRLAEIVEKSDTILKLVSTDNDKLEKTMSVAAAVAKTVDELNKINILSTQSVSNVDAASLLQRISELMSVMSDGKFTGKDTIVSMMKRIIAFTIKYSSGESGGDKNKLTLDAIHDMFNELSSTLIMIDPRLDKLVGTLMPFIGKVKDYADIKQVPEIKTDNDQNDSITLSRQEVCYIVKNVSDCIEKFSDNHELSKLINESVDLLENHSGSRLKQKLDVLIDLADIIVRNISPSKSEQDFANFIEMLKDAATIMKDVPDLFKGKRDEFVKGSLSVAYKAFADFINTKLQLDCEKDITATTDFVGYMIALNDEMNKNIHQLSFKKCSDLLAKILKKINPELEGYYRTTRHVMHAVDDAIHDFYSDKTDGIEAALKFGLIITTSRSSRATIILESYLQLIKKLHVSFKKYNDHLEFDALYELVEPFNKLLAFKLRAAGNLVLMLQQMDTSEMDRYLEAPYSSSPEHYIQSSKSIKAFSSVLEQYCDVPKDSGKTLVKFIELVRAKVNGGQLTPEALIEVGMFFADKTFADKSYDEQSKLRVQITSIKTLSKNLTLQVFEKDNPKFSDIVEIFGEEMIKVDPKYKHVISMLGSLIKACERLEEGPKGTSLIDVFKFYKLSLKSIDSGFAKSLDAIEGYLLSIEALSHDCDRSTTSHVIEKCAKLIGNTDPSRKPAIDTFQAIESSLSKFELNNMSPLNTPSLLQLLADALKIVAQINPSISEACSELAITVAKVNEEVSSHSLMDMSASNKVKLITGLVDKVKLPKSEKFSGITEILQLVAEIAQSEIRNTDDLIQILKKLQTIVNRTESQRIGLVVGCIQSEMKKYSNTESAKSAIFENNAVAKVENVPAETQPINSPANQEDLGLNPQNQPVQSRVPSA